MRSNTCRECGREFYVRARFGRRPVRCPECTTGCLMPSSMQAVELEQRIADLKQQLELREIADQGGASKFIPGADRQMMVRAIRKVSYAEGERDTIAALEHLRDVASSWAIVLGGDGALSTESFEDAA